MNKKIVSMVVFVMLGGAARVFAADGVVDKNVLNVDNTKYAFTCVGDSPNEAVQIQIANIYGGVNLEVVSGAIYVIGGEKLKLKDGYSATATSDDSFLYKVTNYNLQDDDKNSVGSFSISKKNPGMTRGGFEFPHCGRAGCDIAPIIPKPKTPYSALLKIYGQEIPFTCQ